ncbi:MAG: InlB B-repeat-containing protein, partial [Oscillospiraceae bacterium]
MIDGTKAAATPAAAKQQFVLAGQKSRQLYNISADMIKLLKAVNNSCGDTKVAEMTDCINKFENLYNGITRAVEASDRAMTTDNISNMSANANQIYYWNSMPSNNPDSLMQGIKKALPTFAEKATSNTLKLLLAGINSLAVYDSALINNMYSSAAALQMASGVYCDFNTSGVVGASSQNVVINDMLLGNFAKMFDDSIENVPQYVDDIQRWYDLSAQYGSTYLQQPQSITNLMPAYGSEYDVGAVNEGYDLFITLDDYYIVNGAYLYVNSGDVQLEVYDASDGGSGKLLFTYEKTTSAMTTWIRLADGNNVIGDDTRYFTADAKTTPTNKLRFVWKHGGPLAGELAMYGRKAYSTSGNTVPPVAGSLSSNRNRNVTVNLVSGRPEFPNQSISGMSLPSDKPNTTLAAEGKTLPAYDTVTATDPISGNVARYRFVGWFTNVAGTPGNEFTINTPFSTTVSIYGKWAELPAYEQVILTPSMFSTTDITYRKGNIPFMCDQQSRLPSQGEFGLGKATPIPLTIDLGRLMEIKQLTMITGSGTDHNAKYFVSQDNQEYTLVYDKLNVLHSSPDNCYLETQITGNPPVYARYIKMEIGGNTAELFVYASEIDPATLQHTINFVTNVEGMTVPPQAIGHGQFIAIPTMVREGYSFGGWYSDAALSVPFDIAGAVISGRTLYARWISNASHTVTYISNGTVYDVVIGYESATSVITPTPTSTNGSTFQGWYINTLYDLPFQSGATVNSDTILFAKWSQIPSGFIPISANNVVSIDGESNKSNWTYTTDQINKWFDYSRGAISYGSLNTANDGQGEKYTSIVIDLGEVYDLTKFQLVTRYGANTVVVTARMGVTLSTMQDVPLSYEIPNTERIVDFTPTAARYGRYIELTNSKHYNFREIIIYGSASYTVDATAVNGIVEAGGNGQYSYGETATLTASSSVNGAVFDGWYIDNVKVSDSRSFSVKLYSSVAPVAKFTTPDTPKLSNNSVLLSRGETVSLLLGGTALPVAWTSSNSTVARVTADGTIIAVSSGFAFIKVSSVSGESVVRIVVDNRDVMEINILGAQIRLDLLSQGLRFLTETKNKHLEANYKNVRYGTILIP